MGKFLWLCMYQAKSDVNSFVSVPQIPFGWGLFWIIIYKWINVAQILR